MPDILHELDIQATPEDVFKAITEKDGIASWWTVHTTADPQVGGMTTAEFYGGMAVMTFKTAKSEAGKQVEWSVEAPSPPGWENTRVTWDMRTGEQGGTTLLLGHRDFSNTEGGYASVSFNWAYYLMSLQKYLETGEGYPHRFEG